MSGHSKWATTKHKKAVIDARRAKSFAKLIKNIEVAAKMGGADLSGNPTLVDAVQKAKKTSVPNDNIDRAIKRGAGLTGESIEYTTIMYEGYGPNGVALLIECLTDNKNRAAAEVRTLMTRNGGTMADPGSVAYNFARKGVIVVPAEGTTEDDVLAAVLDAGAEEVTDEGETFEVITEASDMVAARTALQEAGIDYDSADAAFVPNLKVEIDAETARKVFRLIDALEDSDDVQNIYSNFDLSAEVQAELEARTRPIAVRVLGIDPGLTRCGVGVVDVEPNRTARLVDVVVLRSPADLDTPRRLARIADGIEAIIEEHRPQAVALERVFARSDVSTIMGTAQISGVAMLIAARRELPVALHTPSEVKAAITGYGRADKAQVGAMVARILGLDAVPKPADAADALALAICHAWRTGGVAGAAVLDAAAPPAEGATLTPAQRAWIAAERSAAVSGAARRVKE